MDGVVSTSSLQQQPMLRKLHHTSEVTVVVPEERGTLDPLDAVIR